MSLDMLPNAMKTLTVNLYKPVDANKTLQLHVGDIQHRAFRSCPNVVEDKQQNV